MYGDLALQLITSSHRTTLSSTPHLPIPKYALPLILSIALETRQLGASITAAAELHGQVSLSQDPGLVCALTVQHLAARRNKRCLLAYLNTRVGGLRERWWDSGGALAYLLSPASLASGAAPVPQSVNPPAITTTTNNNNPNAAASTTINNSSLTGEEPADLRSSLSPQELDFLRAYNDLMLDYKSDFLDVLDLSAGIEKPPGELMVDVRVVVDAGEVILEGGERVELSKGERYRLNRSQMERLIVQGYLEEL